MLRTTLQGGESSLSMEALVSPGNAALAIGLVNFEVMSRLYSIAFIHHWLIINKRLLVNLARGLFRDGLPW